MGQTPSPAQEPSHSALRSKLPNPSTGVSSDSPSAQPWMDHKEERSGPGAAKDPAKEATETTQPVLEENKNDEKGQHKKDQQDRN